MTANSLPDFPPMMANLPADAPIILIGEKKPDGEPLHLPPLPGK
jgi:hypothetical protein